MVDTGVLGRYAGMAPLKHTRLCALSPLLGAGKSACAPLGLCRGAMGQASRRRNRSPCSDQVKGGWLEQAWSLGLLQDGAPGSLVLGF